MKTLLAAVSITVLSACAVKPTDATGIYRLSTADQSMVLDVRSSGDYVLQVDAPGRNTDEIRGRWMDERGAGPRLTFHGIVWRGTEPAAGLGIWAATVEGNAAICIDGEGVSCFSKDDQA